MACVKKYKKCHGNNSFVAPKIVFLHMPQKMSFSRKTPTPMSQSGFPR
jgi:hypothetical protein